MECGPVREPAGQNGLAQDARRRVLRVLAEYRGLFFGESPGLERKGWIARFGQHGLRLLSPTNWGG